MVTWQKLPDLRISIYFFAFLYTNNKLTNKDYIFKFLVKNHIKKNKLSSNKLNEESKKPTL